jgi:hypothetical protein
VQVQPTGHTAPSVRSRICRHVARDSTLAAQSQRSNRSPPTVKLRPNVPEGRPDAPTPRPLVCMPAQPSQRPNPGLDDRTHPHAESGHFQMGLEGQNRDLMRPVKDDLTLSVFDPSGQPPERHINMTGRTPCASNLSPWPVSGQQVESRPSLRATDRT